MTTEDHTADDTSRTRVLFNRENLRAYFTATIGIIAIVALYYLLLGPASAGPPPNGPPSSGPPEPPPNNPPTNVFNSWPLWGRLILPSLPEIVLALVIIGGIGTGLVYFYRQNEIYHRGYLMIAFGVVAIIATNLIHGWEIGIVQPIGGSSEIFSDVFKVNSIIEFVSNYETLQPTLTVHAQTQPPGAVLLIYMFYILFKSPGLIAIGLALIAGIGSAFFIRGIFRRLFDGRIADYGVFLYLLLPAVQVYYLANIYAIVATLVSGVVYFYLHNNKAIAFVGSFVCLFLLTFITFLSAFMVLFLFIFETLKTLTDTEAKDITSRIFSVLRSLRSPVLLTVSVGAIYGLLLVTIGFNYIDAFLYASSLENPNGFMLFANPIDYIVTRVQNVLDIVIFFGPVLSVLAYRGLMAMREERGNGDHLQTRYNLAIAALISLALLFLTGAPKKGETARICMFVLPFLLIPVLGYIENTKMTRREKFNLLILVFGQAVLFQLFGLWVW